MGYRLYTSEVKKEVTDFGDEVYHVLSSNNVNGKVIGIVFCDNTSPTPYIVAYGLQYEKLNSICWEQGHYCSTLEGAIKKYSSYQLTCNDEYNMIFAMGYDLQLNFFLSERHCECDVAFEFCKKIYNDFLKSEFNSINKPEYDCLGEFVARFSEQELDNILVEIRTDETED